MSLQKQLANKVKECLRDYDIESCKRAKYWCDVLEKRDSTSYKQIEDVCKEIQENIGLLTFKNNYKSRKARSKNKKGKPRKRKNF